MTDTAGSSNILSQFTEQLRKKELDKLSTDVGLILQEQFYNRFRERLINQLSNELNSIFPSYVARIKDSKLVLHDKTDHGAGYLKLEFELIEAGNKMTLTIKGMFYINRLIVLFNEDAVRMLRKRNKKLSSAILPSVRFKTLHYCELAELL